MSVAVLSKRSEEVDFSRGWILSEGFSSCSDADLQEFIDKSLRERSGNASWFQMGTIGEDAQKRIAEKCGHSVSKIYISNVRISEHLNTNYGNI